MRNHSGLREGEGEERADREQRDQVVGDPIEGDKKQRRQRGQYADSVGIHQPPTTIGEGVRQVTVFRHCPAQAWEIRKGGVRREAQDHHHGEDADSVECSFARNGGEKLPPSKMTNVAIIAPRDR